MSGIIQPMSGSLIYNKQKSYNVSTPLFVGPLDLLLQLIERAELDITKLSLAYVTNQYLEHIHTIQNSNSEEISSFLVVASKLVQIKSTALLPSFLKDEIKEEDVSDQLVNQLIEYKRFKDVADKFSMREGDLLRSYLRVSAPIMIQPSLDLSDVTLIDLFRYGYQALHGYKNGDELGKSIKPHRITIRQMISFIAERFRGNKSIGFKSLFDNKTTRLEVVVTFVALLELIKQKLVQAYQNKLFGDIQIEANENWDLRSDFDLEFGE